jgi:RNA polymerase sigma factor (sigma-70 family)
MEPSRSPGVQRYVTARPARADLRLVVNGPSTFEAFYRTNFTRAARLAWLLTRSSLVAEDLAQEAFAALEPHFEDIGDPKRYLDRVIVNRARTWQRDDIRYRHKHALAAEQPAVTLSPSDMELFDIIGKLPYRQRAVIVARFWAGWSQSEIADLLGCRLGTVKSLTSRALQRLRKEVSEHD